MSIFSKMSTRAEATLPAKAPLMLMPLSGPKDQEVWNDSDGDSDDSEDDDWDGDLEDEENDRECEFVDAEDEAGAEGAAALDAARYANLCEEYERTLDVYRETADSGDLPIAPFFPAVSVLSSVLQPLTSAILDNLNHISIEKMLNIRKRHRSGTSTQSERAVRLDPKFVAREDTNHGKEDKSPNNHIKELAHRTQIAQDLHDGATKPKTARQIHWQTVAKEITQLVPEKGKSATCGSVRMTNTNSQNCRTSRAKNINQLYPLQLGNFTVMRHPKTKQVYLGEVLDIYSKGSSSHYGSLLAADGVSGLSAISLQVYQPIIMDIICCYIL
jgi:hypothetical protein